MLRLPVLPAFLIAGLSLLLCTTHAGPFKDLVPVADAQVQSGDPNANAGSFTSFFIQSADSSNTFGNERAWLRFDLNGQIPPGAVVTSAKLRIYAFQADSADDLLVDVHGSTDDSWLENSITWNSQPTFGPALSSTNLLSPKTQLWYELDVTSFVAAELAGDGVVSLVAKPQTESTNTWKTYRFNSREFNRDGYSLLPRLRVEYDGTWPSTNAIRVIHTNDIHSRLTTHGFDFVDGVGSDAGAVLEEAGGAAYLGAKVVELKKLSPDALVLDAGDISEGNPLGDLRGNGGTVDYFQELNAQLKGLTGNLGGRGVDAVVVGNHDVRELAMLENMQDPDGDGVVNGWVDTNADDIVDTFNPPSTDPDDVPYLAVNVVRDGASKPAPALWPIEMPFRPYVVVSIGSTRIGVLGYLTDDSAILTGETVNEIDVLEAAWSDKSNGVSTADVVLLEDWVEHLRKPIGDGGEEVDMVILLSHIGHRRLNSDGNVGQNDGNDELLGDQGGVAPPDLVVSGHWHTWTSTAWQPGTLNYKTTNVEASSYGQYVGEVSLTPEGRYISATKHPIRVSDFTIPHPDSEVDAAYDAIVDLLSGLESEYEALTGPDCVIDAATIQAQIPGYVDGRPCPLDYVVGHSAVDLTLDKDKWFTLSEFPWSGDNTAGGWITDAMVAKVRQLDINGDGVSADNAQLGLQSGGGIRRDIAAGPIRYREIFESYPWDDDAMVRVQLSSQDVWNYIEGKFVGSSISEDWQVTAEDGQITGIGYDSDQNGTFETQLIETDDTTQWNVIISEYMYENDDWISETGGISDTFAVIDPTPEYIATDGSTSATPIVGAPGPLEIRDSVVEYTAQFQSGNPMTVAGPRYQLNTEIAGEFEAVVTMTADAETQPFFEAVFVRLLRASAETLARRDLPGDPYGLSSLVLPDGSVDPSHEFSETLLYRSHLGFPDGYLQVGDLLTIKGEFGFFEGNAQFVDQEGIVAAETEFDIFGSDPSLALPTYFSEVADFLVEEQENRLVRFFARRKGANLIEDSMGQPLTVYREGGFFSSSTFLPGANGDCLELIGVSTERADSDFDVRRFRLREAVAGPFAGSTCFPPSSVAEANGTLEAGAELTISATAEDANGLSSGNASSFFAAMDLDGEGDALPLTLTIEDIDISGETGLELQLLVAEDQSNDGAEDWDQSDFVHIDYQIDTGGFQNLLHFENDGSTFNSEPRVDTNFDGTGEGTEITDTFSTFTAAIAGTGATLDLRITFNLNAGDEDIALDDIRIVNGSAQTLYLEDFEQGGGYVTSVPEFTDGSGDFFIRTDGSDISGSVNYQVAGGGLLLGDVTQVEFFVSTDGGLSFVSIGIDTTPGDGFSVPYTPLIEGEYQFYSIATDDDALVEPAPLVADAIVVIAGASGPGSIPRTSLRVERAATAGNVVLSWGESCGSGADDYGIYEGELGNWYSHTLVTCLDAGADLTEEISAGAGNRYFLVVPNSALEEGSYGLDRDGLERPAGQAVCRVNRAGSICP